MLARSKVELSLRVESQAVACGGTVSGAACAVVTASVELRALRVTLTGREYGQVEVRTRSKDHDTTRTLKEENTFYRTVFTCFGDSGGTATLEAGTYSYPFTFTLPPSATDAPPSGYYPLPGRAATHYGLVAYALTLTLDIPNGLDGETELPVVVLATAAAPRLTQPALLPPATAMLRRSGVAGFFGRRSHTEGVTTAVEVAGGALLLPRLRPEEEEALRSGNSAQRTDAGVSGPPTAIEESRALSVVGVFSSPDAAAGASLPPICANTPAGAATAGGEGGEGGEGGGGQRPPVLRLRLRVSNATAGETLERLRVRLECVHTLHVKSHTRDGALPVLCRELRLAGRPRAWGDAGAMVSGIAPGTTAVVDVALTLPAAALLTTRVKGASLFGASSQLEGRCAGAAKEADGEYPHYPTVARRGGIVSSCLRLTIDYPGVRVEGCTVDDPFTFVSCTFNPSPAW